MNSQDPMIDNDDPRLTAYALGELAPAEVAQIEAALKSSPELQAVVADIRRASETISSVFLSQPSLQLTPEQKSQLLSEAESASNFDVRSNNVGANNVRSANRAAANAAPAVASEYYQPSSASSAGWLKIAVAAGLASVLIGGAYYFSQAPRESMTAADREVFEAEPLVRSKAGSDENFDSLQTPPPTNEPNIDELERAKMAETDSIAPPALRSSNQLTKSKQSTKSKRSSEAAAELADAGSDSKYLPPSDMPPSKLGKAAATAGGSPSGARSAAKSDYATKPKDFANRNPKISEPLPAPFSAMAAETKANPNTLTLAQQALDQSILGSLNLTVVAQSYRGDVGGGLGGGGGAGARFSQPLQSSQSQSRLPIERPIEKSAAKKSLANKTTKPNLPATFALQISDQDAVQMVQLWASYADPGQRRKLSFNDLIGAKALAHSLSARKMKLEAPQPNKDRGDFEDADDDDLPVADAAPQDKPSFDNGMPSPASAPPTQQLAAVTLAQRLREFIDRPSPTIRGNAQLYSDSTAIVGASDDKPSLNGAMEEDQLNDLSKNGILEIPQSEAGPESGRKRQRLREFDFDYSQVIEQLKLKLKIRNQSVPGLK